MREVAGRVLRSWCRCFLAAAACLLIVASMLATAFAASNTRLAQALEGEEREAVEQALEPTEAEELEQLGALAANANGSPAEKPVGAEGQSAEYQQLYEQFYAAYWSGDAESYWLAAKMTVLGVAGGNGDGYIVSGTVCVDDAELVSYGTLQSQGTDKAGVLLTDPSTAPSADSVSALAMLKKLEGDNEQRVFEAMFFFPEHNAVVGGMQVTLMRSDESLAYPARFPKSDARIGSKQLAAKELKRGASTRSITGDVWVGMTFATRDKGGTFDFSDFNYQGPTVDGGYSQFYFNGWIGDQQLTLLTQCMRPHYPGPGQNPSAYRNCLYDATVLEIDYVNQRVRLRVQIQTNIGGWQYVETVRDIWIPWQLNSRVRIAKLSSNSALSDHNSNYSLGDAVFEIANSSMRVIATLRTNSFTGTTRGQAFSSSDFTARILKPGSMYAYREVKAPTGFKNSCPDWQWFQATAADMYFDVQDEPICSELGVAAVKLDALTGGNRDLAGRAALGGAEFTVRYWDGSYQTVADAEAVGPPKRTWVIVTDADGEARLSAGSLKAGSDPLYLNAAGEAIVPLGTLVIMETKAPQGYLLPSYIEPLLQEVCFDEATQSCTALTPLTAPNYPSWSLNLRKVNGSTGEPVQGVAFELWRGGELLAAAWTDAQGNAAFPARIIDAFGGYILKETSWPQGWQSPVEAGLPLEDAFSIDEALYAEAIAATVSRGGFTFTCDVSSGEMTIEFTKVNFTNRLIEVHKADADTGAPVPWTRFDLLTYPVIVRDGLIADDISAISADDPLWTRAGSAVSDLSGKIVFAGLPFGYYQLVEAQPAPEYSSYEESCAMTGESCERFVLLDRHSTDEVQVFEDKAIQVSCEVFKDTINVTSAAFRTDLDDILKVDNVGLEQYQYRLGFRSCSNVRADEFTVIDNFESSENGQTRLIELWTPVTRGDSDGLMNLWFRTNRCDPEARYAECSAMATNPHNANNPDNLSVFPSKGWRLWASKLPATASTRLKVADLSLLPGEYITGVRYEYGSVEVGFTTSDGVVELQQAPRAQKPYSSLDWRTDQLFRRVVGSGFQIRGAQGNEPLAPASYLVSCPSAMRPPESIASSASAHIARNIVLTDEARDDVVTTVIAPFSLAPHSDAPADLSTLQGARLPYGQLPSTGEGTYAIAVLACLAALAAAAMAIGRLAHTRKAACTGPSKPPAKRADDGRCGLR